MHVLYVHQNFPAQFGHIAARLVRDRGFRCTFVSQTDPGTVQGIRKIQYRLRGGATEQTNYFSRTFENSTWHASAVYEALKPLRDSVVPDLVVGHSGMGSTLFLPELWPEAPMINHFEYFYRPHGSDMDFRPEWPVPEEQFLRARARNAMILLDLHNCTAGYSPTRFQHDLFPQEYRDKIRVIYDGIDTSLWRRRSVPDELLRRLEIEAGTRIVTYVSRGLESMRGFDIFMRMAKQVYERYPDVAFLVVGSDRVAYGGDQERIGQGTFREHVLAQDRYDLRRFRFLGTVRPDVLVRLLSISDLHVYLTVPFVVSWSLLDAMACGCVVLASDTAPVAEIVQDGRNGLLRGFFDVDGLAQAAVDVLRDPGGHRPLGLAARETIEERYALDVILPRMVELYEHALSRG